MTDIRHQPEHRRPGQIIGDGGPPPPERPAPPTNHPGGEVVIGCNLPMGLKLEVFEEREQWQATRDGGGFVKIYVPNPAYHIARGNAIDIARVANGTADLPTIVNNYALTPGVPRDFWEKWLAQNSDQPYVQNGCIFAEASDARARDRARDRGKNASGLERLDQINPASKSPELRGAFAVRKMTQGDV